MVYVRIRDMREDRDLMQRTVAQYLHCSQVTYSRYECGKRTIPPEILIKLADYYHTSTDYLLGRTNNPPLPRHKKVTACPYLRASGLFCRSLAHKEEVTAPPSNECGYFFSQLRGRPHTGSALCYAYCTPSPRPCQPPGRFFTLPSDEARSCPAPAPHPR